MNDEPDGRPPRDCVVFVGSGISRDQFGLNRPSDTWRPAGELFARPDIRTPAVMIVDSSMIDQVGEILRLPRHVVLVTVDEAADSALGKRAHVTVVGVTDADARHRALRSACEFSTTHLVAARRRRQLMRDRREIRELKRIGMSLMSERDQPALLHRIVDQGKRLTESDAGVLLLAEVAANGVALLRPMLYEFDSLPDLPTLSGSICIDDATIVGHAARTKQPIAVVDAYDLPDDIGFGHSSDFDERYGYRIRSMMVVPMIDHLDKLVGILLFVNHKIDRSATIRTKADADRYVTRYTGRQMRLARALAGQAAVSIENAGLYAQVEHLLESFVKASVSAVDQRDPGTAGHSIRVATLSIDLAEAVQRSDRNVHRHIRFTHDQIRELRFAALLHDFGKVGVHEEVLGKAKKLPPVLWERISGRFELIARTMELEYYKKCASVAGSHSDAQTTRQMQAVLAAQLDELVHLRNVVREANEPDLLPTSPVGELTRIATCSFDGPDHRVTSYLTPEELHFLQIPFGSLDRHERAEIQSHAERTLDFLMQIPWTDDLKNLPQYAYGHHEKLDGSGYPQHLVGDAIPIQSRILSIADIFDALTEADRPYKHAVTPDRALDIIQSEAKAGRLDLDLVDVMLESRVYEKVVKGDWHEL